jgi:uncharacterized protein YndB with AHSA1/START domain
MFAGPGRREIHWKGEYREVVAPKRLVFTVSDRPGEDGYELVVVVLSDLGDGRTDAVPAAWAHVGQAVRTRRGRVVVLLRPHGGAPGRRLTPRVHLPIVCWIWMVRGEGNETKER